MSKENLMCGKCKHPSKYHAIPSEHVLGTSHCTFLDCLCKKFILVSMKGGANGKKKNK